MVVAGEDFHVAGVGGGAVEIFGRPEHPAHQFRQRRIFEVGKPRRPGGIFVRQEQVPETGLLRFGLDALGSGPEFPEIGRVAVKGVARFFDRIDMGVHEGVDPCAQILDLGAVLEIHDPSFP